MISAVIPTRGRPDDLAVAVKSIICQTTPPSELIIVDQSSDTASKEIVEELMAEASSIVLKYILDPQIGGLVEAKHVAVELAQGSIVCFLEDDVVLEPTFLEEIASSFKKLPEMLGCSGVITNPPLQPWYYEFLFDLFHRGIYRDKRVRIYGARVEGNGRLIESSCISGGLSAWRKEVFDQVNFDLHNGFHMYEDIDFSTRVFSVFGNRLYINQNARLVHNCSPINRLTLGARQQKKMSECVTFYRKRRNWKWARISMLWLLAGCFLEASMQSLKAYSLRPMRGYFYGIVNGFSKPLHEK